MTALVGSTEPLFFSRRLAPLPPGFRLEERMLGLFGI